MIDAIDLQLSPFDLSLREYARKQVGCRTLTDQIYGIGELTSVTILAELGDTRRFQNSRDAVRYGGLDITVRESDQRRAPGVSVAKDRPLCAGRSTRRRKPRAARAAQTASTTNSSPSGSARTVRASRSPANS